MELPFHAAMRTTFDRLAATARSAEAAGFDGIAGMDHLVAAGAEKIPPSRRWWPIPGWRPYVEAQGQLAGAVRCVPPAAVLAQQAVSLDHASGGRFELGIGWGSYANDFGYFGLKPERPRDRVQRLRETLEVLQALWTGEEVDYSGQFHTLTKARQVTKPLGRIPSSSAVQPKTMALVRDFADWWNLDIRYLDQFEGGAFEDCARRPARRGCRSRR